MQNKKFVRIMMTVLGVLALVFIGIFSFYMMWEKAPDVGSDKPKTSAEPVVSETKEPDLGLPFDTERQDGVYTVLLVGNDDGNGNTDTIMVGKIDTNMHKMDFVSIPRDTLINNSWEVRKINAVYGGSLNSGGNGIDSLIHQVKRLIGFEVDCYAVIDLSCFIDTVDALGGVYFDVPQAMYYNDPSQDLYIALEPGYQLLDGYQAMGVCRYRSGYADGDLGRINMQHEFLKACAEQFITLGNIPNISTVVDILSEGLNTNMSAANIAFFLRQALQCKPENINFHTPPTTLALIHGYSYALLEVWGWLDMVNAYINPFATPVAVENVDIIYRSDNGFSGTAGIVDEWYFMAPEPTVQPEETTVPTELPDVIAPPTEDPNLTQPEATPAVPPEVTPIVPPEVTPIVPPEETPSAPPEETPAAPPEETSGNGNGVIVIG